MKGGKNKGKIPMVQEIACGVFLMKGCIYITCQGHCSSEEILGPPFEPFKVCII